MSTTLHSLIQWTAPFWNGKHGLFVPRLVEVVLLIVFVKSPLPHTLAASVTAPTKKLLVTRRLAPRIA